MIIIEFTPTRMGQYEEEVLNIYQNDENRFHDPIYNNPNAEKTNLYVWL